MKISERKTGRGQSAIVFTKTFSGGTKYVEEEVRDERKKLAFYTGYKKVTPGLRATQRRTEASRIRPKRAGADSGVSLGAEVNGVNDEQGERTFSFKL